MESASRRYPSFSSTLLDEIYRSIDQEESIPVPVPVPVPVPIPIPTKQCGSTTSCFKDDERRPQASLVQKWIENQAAASTAARRSASETYIKPKPIRTQLYGQDDSQTISRIIKTKSKAFKILKHPISPGGRLATFLNSLFTNNKKSKSANASTCSSASSFSRSYLINTPSSTNGFKGSVTFNQPSRHDNEEKKLNLNDKNRNILEAERNLLKDYQKKVECKYEKESDDGGSSSDSSSDLFELHNISAHLYREELPLYETTQLDTNPLFM